MTRKPSKPSRSAPFIHVGASPQTIIEAKKAIVEILKLPHVDNETKRYAISELNNLAGVNNTTISNSTFQG